MLNSLNHHLLRGTGRCRQLALLQPEKDINLNDLILTRAFESISEINLTVRKELLLSHHSKALSRNVLK